MTASKPDGETIDGLFGDRWIDISRPLNVGTPVWPGDRALELVDQVSKDGLLVTALSTTCHVGTHLDAPLHLDPGGLSVDKIPLERLIGPAEVVHLKTGSAAAVADDLPSGWVPRHPGVLLRSDSHAVDAPIVDGFSGLSAELVHWLADHGVLTLGIDTPSVDVFPSTGLEAHHALVDRDMTWIEGLDLDGVEPGSYMLVALPMPLKGVEAAPVRALLHPLAGLS